MVERWSPKPSVEGSSPSGRVAKVKINDIFPKIEYIIRVYKLLYFIGSNPRVRIKTVVSNQVLYKRINLGENI